MYFLVMTNPVHRNGLSEAVFLLCDPNSIDIIGWTRNGYLINVNHFKPLRLRAITSLKDWPYKHGLGVGNESVCSTAQHWAVHPHTLPASFPCTARLFNLSLNSNNANFCLSLLDLISITFLQKDCNWYRNAFCFPFLRWGAQACDWEAVWPEKNYSDFEERQKWCWVPTPLLAVSEVILRISAKFSKPQFLHLQNRVSDPFIIGLW